MTPSEMAEALLEQFAKRAQREEDAAYKRYRVFIDAAEKLQDRIWERQP